MAYWDTGAIYSSTDAINPVVRFDYSAEGWQTSRIPESVTSPGTLDPTRAMYWDYLPDGLLHALLDQGGERVLYSYDADGNRTAATHANGITTAAQSPLTVQSSFDGFDELSKVRTQKPGVSGTWLATRFRYDLHGNPSEMTDTAEENDAGTETAAGRLFTYAYDAADQLTTQTDNFATAATTGDDEQYTFTWTPTHLLDTRKINKASGGSWTQEQRSARTYYENGALHTLTNYDGANTIIEDHTLTYIASNIYMNGNRVTDTFKLKNADGGTTCWPGTCTASWAYDARDRLTQEVNGTGQTTTFDLDPIGNVYHEQTTGQPAIDRTFNGQQLVSVKPLGGAKTRYLYDSYGNVDCTVDDAWTGNSCPGAGNTTLQTDYIYDYGNRLAGTRFYSAGTLTDSVDYVNDPLDRPVTETETHSGSTTTTQFTYIGISDAVTKEVLTGATSTAKTYAYDGVGERATITDGSSRYSYTYDPHESVSLLIDQNNGVKASYGYGAYGGSNAALTKTAAGFNASSNPYRYTSKRYDTGSKTFDMGARRYSASTQRFLQEDIYFDALDDLDLATDPLDANRYGIAGANPINFVEVDGHMTRPSGGAGGKPRTPEQRRRVRANQAQTRADYQQAIATSSQPVVAGKPPPKPSKPNKPNKPNKPDKPNKPNKPSCVPAAKLCIPTHANKSGHGGGCSWEDAHSFSWAAFTPACFLRAVSDDLHGRNHEFNTLVEAEVAAATADIAVGAVAARAGTAARAVGQRVSLTRSGKAVKGAVEAEDKLVKPGMPGWAETTIRVGGAVNAVFGGAAKEAVGKYGGSLLKLRQRMGIRDTNPGNWPGFPPP